MLFLLPSWRKNVDYKKSITAIASKGGGIQNELSHEIDYMIYFWHTKAVFAIQNNSNRLKINMETINIIFEFTNNFNININLSII